MVQSFLSSHHRWQSNQRRLDKNSFSLEFRIGGGNSKCMTRPIRKSTNDILELKSSLSDLDTPLPSHGINAGNFSAFLDFDGEIPVLDCGIFWCPSNGKGYLDMFSYQITALGITLNIIAYEHYTDDDVLKSSHTLNLLILCRTDSFPKQTP